MPRMPSRLVIVAGVMLAWLAMAPSITGDGFSIAGDESAANVRPETRPVTHAIGYLRIPFDEPPERFAGKLHFDQLKEVKDSQGNWVVLGRRGEAVIQDENGRDLERRPLPIGTVIKLPEGSEVKQGELIAEWDPFSIPILTDVSGVVQFKDIFEGETFKEQVDEVSGVSRKVIQESGNLDRRPMIGVCDENGQTIIRGNDTPAEFALPVKAELVVEDGKLVHAGDILAKIPRELAKNKDITGGLPRVAELFDCLLYTSDAADE